MHISPRRSQRHNPQLKVPQEHSGVSNLGVLLLVLIIAVVGYVASQVFPFYYGSWELQAQFESMVEKAQIKSDKEIRDYLTGQMRANKINAEPADLKIVRRGRSMTIDLEYTETLTFTLSDDKSWDLHQFTFHPRAEGDF